jgi:DNA-binding CsgD family transcriptional regulator
MAPAWGPNPLLLCPDLVGRETEADDLRGRVVAMSQGRGGVVVLVGDAGAGKTRLAREAIVAAQAADVPVLSGRAVPGANPVPYRPLTEAFLGHFRSAPLPSSKDLAGFEGHLQRLVPIWQTGLSGGADESPLLLGEAVVRLLRSVGGADGSLLLLEDLHWADPETLAVIEYLADALASERTLCVCTARPDSSPATALLDRLQALDATSTIRVTPLQGNDIDHMVQACTSMTDPPIELMTFLRTHSDGLPFLVEELLAGVVAAGELRFDGGRWVSDGDLTPTLPGSLQASIQQRLVRLDRPTRSVLGAAALLGRHFDWELLPGIAEVDGRTVVDGLRTGVDEQLIAAEGSGFVFRHALTREAILADLLPPDRRAFAQRALAAIERAHPGLPGAVCELAAELAEAAGDESRAAAHLLESARRAHASGAHASAEVAARRARRLADADPAVRLDAEQVLVRILAAAGKPGEALDLGGAILQQLTTDHDPVRRADLYLEVARAAVAAGDHAAAADYADRARAVLPPRSDASLGARIDAVAAHVALEQARLDDATSLAESAVAEAASTNQPAVECEALEVLGRVTRARDIAASKPWFERAAEVAARAGLVGWQLRAQQELAILAWGGGDAGPLQETRDLAARHGALITVAVMDLSLANIALVGFDREGALRAAQACVEASSRYGLATEPVAFLWLAGAYALADDEPAMQTAIDAALRRDPLDPRILGDLYGQVLATLSIVRGDLAALPGLLDTMMEHARLAPPTTSIFPSRIFWATLHATDDDDLGEAAEAEFSEITEAVPLPTFLITHRAVRAIRLGRQGDVKGATATIGEAYDQLREHKIAVGSMHTQRMLTARAASRDGWGEPVLWLREAEAFFASNGYEQAARRCRIMIGDTGAPVPRRGRGHSEVPAALRALGITSREVDVLKLVMAGPSNREIGHALFLSTKTVERHLSSLFARTGTHDRHALGDVARSHGFQVG